MVYGTYLGGSGADYAYGQAVDPGGYVYVTGKTTSADFPTVNPIDGAQGGDAFVSKLRPAGDSLEFSTYLGGGGNDEGTGIALDTAGNIYVAGRTFAPDFPTVGPYQTNQPLSDAVIFKLNPTGSSLVYSTYLGGSDEEGAEDIAVGASGQVYVVGNTASTDFPLLGAIQSDQPGTDAFITKLNSSGNGLSYSTYAGGSDVDLAFAVAVDTAERAYVAGTTYSSDLPTLNSLHAFRGGLADVFIWKLNGSGSGLEYGTFLGGFGSDGPSAIAVDAAGSAYVVGNTFGSSFPVVNPVFPFGGLTDGFVAKLNPAGNALVYGTFLGGSNSTWPMTLPLICRGMPW
jgi:hypothetical protein